MTVHALTLLIVLMGAATVFLSGFVALRFWWLHVTMQEDGRKLTIALVGMLIGELTIGIVTLIFALLAWSGHLPKVAVEIQSLLRFVAFGATSFTTIHLALVVEQMHEQKK